MISQSAQWMLEEFKARNQVAYERYDSLTKQEQGIMDRWQALEYRLNPPAALVTGNQNGTLSGRNDPYGIFDTRQPVGYDKGKEGGGNELSQAGRGWGQPNRTNPGRPNAYAEYLAYKQKVQARRQSLALEQALQQLFVQEKAARAAAGPQAFAYNGADGFASIGYETGGAFGSGGLDGGSRLESASPAADSGGAIGLALSEKKVKIIKYGSDAKSEIKLNNQMNKRGWTKESIQNTVGSPYTTRRSKNLATQNSATVYYNKDGSYVILDDVTNEVVQISNRYDPDWTPDTNIQNPYKSGGN